MECRPKSYRVGDRVGLSDTQAYPLPMGLTDGQSVTIFRIEAPRVFVRDDEGLDWDLFLTNIDSGMEYLLNGRWVFA